MQTSFLSQKQRLSKSQQSIVGRIHQFRSTLTGLSDPQLIGCFNDLRESVFNKRKNARSKLIDRTIAVAQEATYRVLGVELYDVQLIAGHALIAGHIAEMQTGEGKTISAVPAAVFGGMSGAGVHIATPNSYLAKRDFDELKSVYEFLGFSAGLIDSNKDVPNNNNKSMAYGCDITYGPGYEFGFDYLRDQLILKKRKSNPPGQNLLAGLQGAVETHLAQRGLAFSIVDEADNVLLDDATSPQVLSEFQPGEAPDIDAVLLAKMVAADLEPSCHFREISGQQIELTAEGVETIHDSNLAIPVKQLKRPWAKYVESALRARLQFRRDVHYVVIEDEVRIVDESTGRIFEDRSWQSGLHQAIEAKERVKITPESLPLAQITRQRFYRLYNHLGGMTGTAANCSAEFKTIYNIGVSPIPLRVPSQRTYRELQAFDCAQRKWDAIAGSINSIHSKGQPVLIGTRTILESQLLAEKLESAGLDFEMLNGKQDADEAEVVSNAGQLGAITIATNLAGRGTDIKIDDKVVELGGLHVIVSECHASARFDRQLVGRCARQGQPGSCQAFVSADDWLFATHAPWLAESIRTIAHHGKIEINVEPDIRKLQNRLERHQYALRLQLMTSNDRKNKIIESLA